jgi:hypothetical protein
MRRTFALANRQVCVTTPTSAPPTNNVVGPGIASTPT